MKTFRAKPIWTGTPDPLVAGQWTPAPHWATHILKNQHGSYAWAEQFGELYLGEPRYRSDVQSRDVFTIGPAAWQVVEARPVPGEQRQQAIAELRAEVERLRAFEAEVELETVAWLDVSDATDHMTPTERVLKAVRDMKADAKAHQETQRASAEGQKEQQS